MILTVHAKPNAHVTEVISWFDEQTVAISLRATPADGEANEELVEFLAEKLGIPKTFINIKSGHTSRVKKIELPEGTKLSALKTTS